MCVVCNPTCGKCRPARQKAVPCPQCGWMNVLDARVVLGAVDASGASKASRIWEVPHVSEMPGKPNASAALCLKCGASLSVFDEACG